MLQKKLILFWRIIIVLFVFGSVVILAGRNNIFLGSILGLLRWIVVAIGIGLLYLTLRRITHKSYKVALIISTLLLLAEYSWNKTHEKSLGRPELTDEVSLMTYNIFFKNSNPQSSLTKIEEVEPDILVIQELTTAWKTELENSIGHRYRYKKIRVLEGTHGIGIYSKFPIAGYQLLGSTSRPYAQVLELNIHNKKVQLFNVHLASPAIAVEHPENFITLFKSNYELRRQQLESIDSIASQTQSKFNAQILVGDLNTTRYEPIYRNLTLEWVDFYSVTGTGFGFNFPNSKKMEPLLTLDYIFGRGDIGVTEMKIIDGGSSDHLALAGKIKL